MIGVLDMPVERGRVNCVNTNILLIPEFIQLEMGISTNRYLPAIGTAGLERLAVNGYNLEPAPPPNITLSISLEIDIRQTYLWNLYRKVKQQFILKIQTKNI